MCWVNSGNIGEKAKITKHWRNEKKGHKARHIAKSCAAAQSNDN